MNFKFNYLNKDIIVGDVEECKSFFQKLRGLMFRRNPKTLVFVFDKPVKTGIHSFFVNEKFLAIWLLKGRVIDVKIVRPWNPYVRPKIAFDRLLEIPFKSELEISEFLVGSKKAL